MVNPTFWNGKRVLLTGHTGFKGSWLSFWLQKMGAQVYGLALAPDTDPSLFKQLELEKKIDHHICDVRDAAAVSARVTETAPDVVFHMAAQPLVLRSYSEPYYTWQVNVTGTLNLMEALRQQRQQCAVVMVTTDKVYENIEKAYAYRETDRLGGMDPYSSGKAAMELAVHSWRESFFKIENRVRLATARAGNVIGGGDWAENRIVPDLIRALHHSQEAVIRSPQAVRPWQHVLEPLSGYLVLAQSLYQQEDSVVQTAFNFGPMPENSRTVRQLVEQVLRLWPGNWKDGSDPAAPHEASLLSVDIRKAGEILGWKPKWDFEASVEKSVNWYRSRLNGMDAGQLTATQIEEYTA